MFDRLKPTVFALLHTVLGIKMTSALVGPFVLPPVAEHIITYNLRLTSMKKADGLEILKKWRVTCIKGYKSKTASRHEYITATVVDSDNKTSYVKIERERGDPNHLSDANINRDIDPAPLRLCSASSPSLSSIPSSFSSPSISSISDSPLNHDMIAQISSPGKKKESDVLIYELIFGETQLYLYQLAVLAYRIHMENKRYLLIENNCYHYAGTIMRVLEEEYNVVNTVVDTGAGKWWCGVPVYSLKNGRDTSSLSQKFREEIKAFVSLQC